MYSFIELLRAIAALLITNSHFDGVYPWNISWGGCPGVALFFTITGFLLVKSAGKEQFVSWWIKKVIRLYIPLTIVNIITVLIGFRKASLSLFLFPVNINLWYVPVIAVLYIPYYLIVRADSQKPLRMIGGYRGISILLTMAAYIALYLVRFRNEFFVEPEIAFRVLYGFIGMMIGSYVYDKRHEIEKSGKGILLLVASFICCGGFLAMKFFMTRIHLLVKLQFMTQVFGVAFAVFALMAGLCYEEQIKRFMNTWAGKVLGVVSKCSLEIYLIQFVIIGYLKHIVFPLNFVIIMVLIICSAYLVHIVSEKIYKTIVKQV